MGRVNIVGAGLSGLSAAIHLAKAGIPCNLISALPSERAQSVLAEGGINAALDNTFGGTWFIILGSSIAFAASAVLNNFLNYGIGRLLKNENSFGSFALRSYVSTFLAQTADNLIFALLVSKLFFGWTLLQCFTCALTGAVMELLFEVLFSPFGYRLSRAILKERENPVLREAFAV